MSSTLSQKLEKMASTNDIVDISELLTIPTFHFLKNNTANGVFNISTWWSQGGSVTSNGLADPSLAKGIPNFISDRRFGDTGQLTIAAPFIICIATLAVLMRVFARSRLCTRYGWDDFLALLAAAFLLVDQVIFAKIDNLGVTTISLIPQTDHQMEAQRRAKIVMGLKFFMAYEILYLLSLWCVKLSTLLLYYRLAKQTKYITFYLRVAIGISLATFAFCILALFLSCIPVSEFWNINNPSSQCSRKFVMIYGTGISNIITNTLVLAVPIPLLMRASLSKRQKYGLCVLYLLGTFVIIASILRFTTQILNVSIQQTIGWSQLEVSLALILACAPMSAKLFVRPLIDYARVPLLYRSNSSDFSLMDEKRARYNKELPELPIDEDMYARELPHVAQLSLTDEYDQERKSPYVQTNKWRRSDLDDKSPVLVKELLIPDSQRLKIIKTNVNGQSVWGVHPDSGGISRPETAISSDTSRSPVSSYYPSTAWPVPLSQRPR